MSEVNCRGSFILEVLMATLLFSVILAMGSSLLVNQLRSFRMRETQETTMRHIWLAEEAIRKAAQSSSRYWGSVNLLATNDGAFNSSNGESINFTPSSPDLNPAENSAILTFREVLPTSRLLVTSTRNNIHSITLSLCGKVDLLGDDNLEDLTSWLALTVDGNYPLAGPIHEVSDQARRCNERSYHAVLTHPERTIFPAECYFCQDRLFAPFKNRSPIVLLEVRSQFSIYVDKGGRLRIFSHINHSNQPIVSGLRRLSAERLDGNAGYRVGIVADVTEDPQVYEMIIANNYDRRLGLEMLP